MGVQVDMARRAYVRGYIDGQLARTTGIMLSSPFRAANGAQRDRVHFWEAGRDDALAERPSRVEQIVYSEQAQGAVWRDEGEMK